MKDSTIQEHEKLFLCEFCIVAAYDWLKDNAVDGEIKMSRRELANKWHVPIERVDSYLKRLCAAGFIEWNRCSIVPLLEV